MIKVIARSRPQLRGLLRRAAKAGLRSVVHIGSWEDARFAVLEGASAITHLDDDEMIPEDLARLMASKKVWSIPTMAVQCDFAAATSEAAFLEHPLLRAVTGESLRSSYREKSAFTEKARYWMQWQAEQCRTHDFESIRRLVKAGVGLLAGSDSGNLGTFEGYSMHRELALLVEAGVPPWQALAAATTSAGNFLGRHYGIQPGDEANLVVLEASPVAQIGNTTRISRVMVRGVFID